MNSRQIVDKPCFFTLFAESHNPYKTPKPLDFSMGFFISSWPDSNRRPTHYECVALPTALQKRPNKNALDLHPKHMTSSGIEPEFTP